MEMMLEVLMGIEVDKVADEVADMMVEMEVTKVAEMVAKIPTEDFTDVTLAIVDTYGDGDGGGGHGGWKVGR